jgi:hypothetical protein
LAALNDRQISAAAMEYDHSAALIRYAFVAIFIPACIYKLQLGVQVGGVYLAGISLYGLILGKVRLVDLNWKTTGYSSGAMATAVNAVCMFVGVFFLFCPEWVISVLKNIKS